MATLNESPFSAFTIDWSIEDGWQNLLLGAQAVTPECSNNIKASPSGPTNKNIRDGSGERAVCLRALILAQDQGSVPSTDVVANNHTRGPNPFSGLWAL